MNNYKILIDTIAKFNNGWKPDFSDHEQLEEYFVYQHGGYGLSMEQDNHHQVQCVRSELYMDQKACVAEKVIKALGEEFIIKTLGFNEDGK